MFIICFFCFGFAVEYPKFSILIISKKIKQDNVDNFVHQLKENELAYCDGDESCIALVNSIDQVIVSRDNPQIQDRFKQFSSDNDYLYIYSGGFSHDFDLNLLKSKMHVIINRIENFDEIFESMINPFEYLVKETAKTFGKIGNYRKLNTNKS